MQLPPPHSGQRVQATDRSTWEGSLRQQSDLDPGLPPDPSGLVPTGKTTALSQPPPELQTATCPLGATLGTHALCPTSQGEVVHPQMGGNREQRLPALGFRWGALRPGPWGEGRGTWS